MGTALPGTRIAAGQPGESSSLLRQSLPEELSQFLSEFSVAVHRHGMYPPGHPALREAAADVMRAVAKLLYDRPTLSIGVARKQLVIEGLATDARNPVLRGLAERLHDRYVGAIVFQRGVAADEILDVLGLLGTEPDREAQPIGLADPDRLGAWMNVRLFPLTYDGLELVDQEVDEPGPVVTAGMSGQGLPRAAQLWLGLARAALASEAAVSASASTDAVDVARAIEDHPAAPGYDQLIVDCLLQITQQLKEDKAGSGGAALRRRVSQLVVSLSEDTLQRLVEMGGDHAQRKKFLLDAAEGFAVDAVIELVRAAAASSRQTVSTSMVRLLSKLSAFAESGADTVRPLADRALREQVKELVAGWSLKDPNPQGYTAALDGLSRSTLGDGTESSLRHEPEPLRIVQLALEVGAVGPVFHRAVDALLQAGEMRALVALLADAPDGSPPAELVWGRLATRSTVLELVREQTVDFGTLDRILAHVRDSVGAVLLDALAQAESRTTRLGLLSRLARMGPALQPLVIERLHDGRWYVQRNMLSLLREIGCPPDFTVAPYTRHPEPAVRREAYALGVTLPAERDRTVSLALADRDGRAFRIGVHALESGGVPAAAIPLIANRLGDDRMSTDLRTPMVQALSGVRSPLALEGLLKLVVVGRTALGRPVLAPRSPELLAALAALADTWAKESRVRAVLARARGSSDPEIRTAASSASRT